VQIHKGLISCTRPDSEWRAGECKHIAALRSERLLPRHLRVETLRIHARDDDQPAPLCSYCGQHHFPSGVCPEDASARRAES
jgi:hypothetical protein